MLYKCKRCGFLCDQKNGLRRHLNRKIQCEAKLDEIDIETLKHELEGKGIKMVQFEPKINPFEPKINAFEPKNTLSDSNIKVYTCNYCSKSYSTNSHMCRHMKTCKKKEEVIKESSKIAELEVKLALKDLLLEEKLAEKEEKLALKDLLLEAKLAEKDAKLAEKDAEMTKRDELMKEQIDFMKKQIEILMKKAGNNTTNTDNSVNNTDNSINDNKQINININGFGKEDLSYLSDRYFRELFNIPFSAIPTLVEDIHFNPKKPQNWNAKIQDDKTSKALVYNAEKEMWVKREKKEVINEMVEKSYNMLDANFDIQKEAKTLDEKGKRKFENFMKVYDKGDKQLDKRYETEIREKLMNFKEYHR